MDSKNTPGFRNLTCIKKKIPLHSKNTPAFQNHTWIPKPHLHSCSAQPCVAATLCLSKKRENFSCCQWNLDEIPTNNRNKKLIWSLPCQFCSSLCSVTPGCTCLVFYWNWASGKGTIYLKFTKWFPSTKTTLCLWSSCPTQQSSHPATFHGHRYS